MKILLLFGKKPYDGTDAAWNGLRLTQSLLKKGHDVWLFLINDGIDLARPDSRPEGAEFDLAKMLEETAGMGAVVKLCKTCITRCGIGGNTFIPAAAVSTMPDLAECVIQADKVITISS